jgi:hypothetical protein
MSHEALRQALAEWRQAEQRLVDATPGSPEWADARDAVEDARRRYRDLATVDASARKDDAGDR